MNRIEKFSLIFSIFFLVSIIFSSINYKSAQAVEIKDKVQILVNNVYLNVYKRNPDDEGFNYWVNRIKKSEISPEDFIRESINTREFMNLNYSDYEFVQILYKTILNREPEEDGVKYWTSQLSSKAWSRIQVLNRFVDGPEFKDNWSKPIYILVSGKISDFVERVYKLLLNRQPDVDGQVYWIQQLRNKNITPAGFMYEGINSDEFKSHNYLAGDFIKILYRVMFGREADDAGYDYWLNLMVQGYSRNYILARCVQSDEFKALTTQFGFSSPGEIALRNEDFAGQANALGITKSSRWNIYSSPNTSASWNVDTPVGCKVTIESKVRGIDKGKAADFYKISAVINRNIYTGYIRAKYYGSPTVMIYTDTNAHDYLGILSEQYESGGDAGAISSGVGDAGGKSYGAWQFASNVGSLKTFVLWLKNKNYNFYERLYGAMQTDYKNEGTYYGNQFDAQWRDIAAKNYEEFYNLQHEHIYENYYNAMVKKLVSNKYGYNYEKRLRSFAVRNVFWSSAVHHGVTGGFNIVMKFGQTENVSQFISSIYDERGRKNSDGTMVYFPKSSPSVQASVANRLVNECKDALAIWNQEQAG